MKLIQDILCKEAEWIRLDLDLDNAKFKHSTVNEFIAEMKKLTVDQKYPFFFVNASTVEYDLEKPDDIIVSVGEIVIATTALANFTSEQRDEKVFNPILSPFLNQFLYRMDYNQEASIYKAGKIKYQYRYGVQGKTGTESDILDDAVCAIQLTNFQFRILTIKNN